MRSSTLFAVGTGLTLSSFAVPPLGIPLLTGAIASFVAGEIAIRHEEKYVKPVQQRRHAAWLQMLDDAFLYRMGVTQGLARAEIDWQAHHYKSGLNLKGTVEDRYFTLFTAGRPQPQPPQGYPQEQTIDVPSAPSTEAEQPQGQNETEQDDSEDLTSLFAGASPLPETSAMPVEAEVVLDGELVAKESSAMFPTEDIADLIARNTLDRDNCSSMLIACPKGTGKSNLLRAAIYKLHRLSAGTAQINVFNGKEDRNQSGQIVSTFCGIETNRKRYINAGDPDSIEPTYSRLASITSAMESNYDVPMVQVLDEYNNILIAATICTSLLKDIQAELPARERIPPPNYVEKIGLGTMLRITKGRSKLVADWITSHSPLVQDIGLNTKLQQSLTSVVLGRGDKLDAIHAALSGSNPVVKNPQARAQLYETFLQWEQGNTDPYKVVCLTNLAGKWRLCFLPKYPDVQPDVADEVFE